MAPSFQLVVVGCGGGPNESNLSGYLLKPFNQTWHSDQGIIGLECGSGAGALQQLLDINPDLFASQTESDSQTYTPVKIYNLVTAYLVTHSHLDHVQSLILSAGSFGGGVRKRVCAAPQTLNDLENVFNGRVWPGLSTRDDEPYDPHKLLLTTLHDDGIYHPITPSVSVRRMPLSHGTDYEASAMFIKLDSTGHEFLFLGDVEPDSIAVAPRTLNVWIAAASKIRDRTLSSIFLECSWPQGRPTDALFGHLTPEYFSEELTVLATEVARSKSQASSQAGEEESAAGSSNRRARKRRRKNVETPAAPPETLDLRNALNGVRVYVMHCKDPMDGTYEQTRDLIVDQIRQLVEPQGLGAEIVAVIQGDRIDI